MTNTPPTEQEMTDVFSRFSAPLPPASQLGDDRIKISDRKKAALATAAVLLGGGATFAAVNSDLFGNDDEEEGVVPPFPTEDDATDAAKAPLRHDTSSLVQSGTITPSKNIDIAEKVESTMPFSEAYATAREEVGFGGIFSWRGEVYNTYTVEEWQGLSLVQRQDFLVDVGYRPASESLPIDEDAEETQVITGDLQEPANRIANLSSEDADQLNIDGTSDVIVNNEPTAPPALEPTYVEPAYFDLVINGRAALGIDDDHDGIADAIVFIDEGTNSIIAFVDAEDDEMIDTVIQFDATTRQVVGQQAIEEPFMAEISQLEAMSELATNSLDTSIAYMASNEMGFDDADDYTDDSGYVNDAEMPEMD